MHVSDVEAWRDQLQGERAGRKGDGASSIRNALIVLGILYRFAMRDHLVT
jgi:hypothetical protein